MASSLVFLVFLLVFAGFGVACFVWWLIMLIEALRVPGPQWEAAGHNQVLYVIGMICLGVIGTILYVLIPRKDLQARTGF